MPLPLEPLLPDSRVTAVEHAVRRRFPNLPLEAAFATYYQDPETVVLDDGGEVVQPPQAAFVIVVRNPRHPEFDKIWMGRVPYDSWQMEDRAHRHSSEVLADPAYHIFARMVPEVVTWYTNTLALI